MVPQLVAAWAARTPGAPAVVSGEDVLSYGELDRQANQLAHHLRAFGVGPETLVALALPRSVQFVISALAVMRAGGAYVPLDLTYPSERLALMLNDARPTALVTAGPVAGRLPVGRWRHIALDWDTAALARQPSSPPDGVATPERLAYVIYTSGSTGRPKGVQITHASLLNLVAWHQRAFAVTPADRASQLASPGFDAAVWELWPYLTAGASVHLADEAARVGPQRLRDWMVAQAITIGFVPTALAERLLTLAWPSSTRLRYMLTGADTLHAYPPPTLPFALVNNYGPTECTVVATSAVIGVSERPDTRPPIGRPIDGTEIYILDERRQVVPPGEVGEIYIGGVGLARGYLNRPELTAERFVTHPASADPNARMYRTGDRGRYLPDGQIVFLGRTDEQIKLRGFRIEPDEIVTVLNAQPEIEASAVVAREDGGQDRRLVAYVVPTPGADPTPAALQAALGATLPEYMLPSVFVRLPALPLTANGKVDRAALPPPDATNLLPEPEFVAPRTIVEERLARILAGLLELPKVGAGDNFFLLGGHSLLGTQLISRVRDAFGIELPLRSLFERPTVAALATEIEQAIMLKLESETDGLSTPRAA